MSDDIPINNQLAEVELWKPYDFLTFIESELRMRGKDYQVMDLQADLGSIKNCISYAKAVGKGNYSVVQYITWIFDGVKDTELTSLQFLPASLRHYYGAAPASALPKERKVKTETMVTLTADMKLWLDSLKQPPLI